MNEICTKICRLLILVTLLGAISLPAFAVERIFVLRDPNHILQYRMDSVTVVSMVHPYALPTPARGTLEGTYSNQDLPQAFPAAAIEIKSGNILCTYDQNHTLLGRFVYDPTRNALKPYQGNAGADADLAGRILEKPSLDEIFRDDDSLYSTKKQSHYRESMLVEKFKEGTGKHYQGLFILDGRVFGVTGDHIDRLSGKNGSMMKDPPQRALTIPGSSLVAAATSPWNEAFISDSGNHALDRVIWHDGALQTNGSLTDENLVSPGTLTFGMDGELFVANRSKAPLGVVRFHFILDNFVNWRAVSRGGIDLGGSPVLGIALAKPVGFVISEKTDPLVKLVVPADIGHHGISSADFLNPGTNSDAAVVSLVEYEPGGHTTVHYHEQMEQVEIVVAGHAIWEIGEMEKEVGPGDVIYTPRYVKHGYKVLGNAPFKFYQIEWWGHGVYGAN